MTKFALGAALAALSIAIPAAAPAQRIGAAVVAVVDTGRISRECTACRAATAQLQAQQNTLRTRAQTLQQQIRAEGQPIATAVNALGTRQPDAALQQRITALQTRERSAQQELSTAQVNLQSTEAHVNQQILTRLLPIVGRVAQARGANLAVERGATLFAAPALDITAEVMTQLNQQLPTVSVTPLPQQQQQQRPQGR
ncbi:MAG TPA: OmpH family outer membrane protein [Allosphingosinicella sp.]|jgi:Skp family chaperone for outer membrane proteins